MRLQTSLIRWLLLLSGNIALNTLGLSSRYSSNKACEIKKKKTSISSQFTSNGKCMCQERERERERVAYPRRLIEREISEDSRGISRRLNHLVLDQWLPLRLSHHMPPLPVGLHNLILPFPSARAELVVGRNEGTTTCNLTHVYDTIMSLLFLFLPSFLFFFFLEIWG